MSESIQGLTSAEVAERQRQGKTNAAVTLKTKSIKRIFYDNICTLFNLILQVYYRTTNVPKNGLIRGFESGFAFYY